MPSHSYRIPEILNKLKIDKRWQRSTRQTTRKKNDKKNKEKLKRKSTRFLSPHRALRYNKT